MNMLFCREKLSQMQNPTRLETVSGAVCRRFESFQARFTFSSQSAEFCGDPPFGPTGPTAP